jgi:hypothetical protein
LALDFRPPLLLREEDFREDFREEDFRAPPFRRADDLRAPRRDDFRAPPELRLERFRAPPFFRPEDPDRFLPPLERLDFLAAAIGKLRVAGFVTTDSKIRAQL